MMISWTAVLVLGFITAVIFSAVTILEWKLTKDEEKKKGLKKEVKK